MKKTDTKRRKKKAFTNKKDLPFWKKGSPELRHIATHIGKFFDRLTGDQLLDLIAAGVCAAAGAKAGYNLSKGDWAATAAGGAMGVMAYKLAKSSNIVASASGAVTLSTLGLLALYDPISGAAAGLGAGLANMLKPEEIAKAVEELGKVSLEVPYGPTGIVPTPTGPAGALSRFFPYGGYELIAPWYPIAKTLGWLP